MAFRFRSVGPQKGIPYDLNRMEVAMGRPLDPTSEHWKTLRSKILARDKSCFVCGTKQHLTVHHIKPRKHGGKTNERNLITMCGACHDHVEYYDMDWPAIINLQKQKRYGFQDDFGDNENETYKLGKDQFGVFVVRGIKQNSPVRYVGVWPEAVPKVKERPVYYTLPANYQG